MKLNVLLVLFLCSTALSAQQMNKEVIRKDKAPILLGPITTDGLSENSYKEWFVPNYKEYEVDATQSDSLKTYLKEHKVLVFMGTWCGDSKREVPRFVKILEEMDFPSENLKIVAVDNDKENYKKSPTGEEWALDIVRVPTFIFYKEGKEVNRIVETPVESLEKDIKTIVTNGEYLPNYAKSRHFD